MDVEAFNAAFKLESAVLKPFPVVKALTCSAGEDSPRINRSNAASKGPPTILEPNRVRNLGKFCCRPQ